MLLHVHVHVLLCTGGPVGVTCNYTWTLSYTVCVLYIHMYTCTCIFLLQTWYADALQQQLHPLPSAATHFTGTCIYVCLSGLWLGGLLYLSFLSLS